MRRKAAFFYCTDPELDPVAARVLGALRATRSLTETEIVVDGRRVSVCDDSQGNTMYHIATADVISHDYRRYLPILNGAFGDCAIAAVVNWHSGANAPAAVLCAHSTGDVATAQFGSSDPALLAALLVALERERVASELTDFRTLFEATHWSGATCGQDPRLVVEYGVPVVDVEIGSILASWVNPTAAAAVARALMTIFDSPSPRRTLLCVGGIHFEPAFVEPLLRSSDGAAFAVGHILAHQWLAGYAGPGAQQRLRACVESIRGGIHAIAYHASLKGPFKAELFELGESLAIPVLSHHRLRELISTL